jgi:hypothetical protein
LYATWSDRRRKRRGPPATEENEPLSHGAANISDFEKGVAEANMRHVDENNDDFTVRPFNTGTYNVSLIMYHRIPLPQHPDKSDEASVSRTSTTVSELSSYSRHPGFTPSHKPLESSGFGHTPLTKP